MTVYIIQDQKHVDKDGQLKRKFDFEPALEFGELVEVLRPSTSPFNLAPAMEKMHEVLSNYQEGDFLLLTGNPVLLGLAVAIAADYNDGNVSLLQWSGAKHRYIPVHARDIFTEKADCGNE